MKRILALILAVAMLLCLCACGGSGEQTSGGTTENGIFKAVATDINPTVMGTFYRNVCGNDMRSDDPTVKEIDAKADAMLKHIEEYPDTVKAKEGCKTYYVSNNGNDGNDGLTPETARATYLSIKSALVPGDCVLFERGGLWRGQMSCKEGVSYGAYGEGDVKPRFYGSVDGSKNGEGQWTETSTKGVYVFSKPISEYSNIVFNNGEALGRPVQKMEDITKKPLNVIYKGGKVNVYSPEGNPQDIYEVIEIVEGYTMVRGDNSGGKNKDIHIQNLCIMYAGLHGIGSIGGCDGIEIDGCVIGYIGGKDLFLGGYSIGNGIEFWGNVKNTNVHDNYVFQCFDAAVTHQSNSGMKYDAIEEDLVYKNNLIEYNIYSFEAFVSTAHGDNKEYHDRMGDVLFEGNICRYAGWGWGYLDRPDKSVPCDVKYRSGDHTEPLVITGNIFDRAKQVSIMGTVADRSLMKFTNNQVIVFPKRKFMTLQGDSVDTKGDMNAFLNKYFSDTAGTTIKQAALAK